MLIDLPQEIPEFWGGHRTRQQIALDFIATQFAQRVQLFDCFHTLGNHPRPKVACQTDDAAYQ